MTIKEFDIVKVVKDVPEKNVKAGMIGAVIDIATNPCLAYIVDFSDNDGRTILWPHLLPEQVVKIENMTDKEYKDRVMPEGPPV